MKFALSSATKVITLSLFLLSLFCPVGQVFALDSSQIDKVGKFTEKNPNRPVKDKWALVVGVSEFKNPKYNLKYAAKDARDFATALIEKLDFEPDHIKLLIDEQATKKNIMSLLGDTWLPRVARPDDVVVVYFSTHGSPASIDVGKMNFLMAHDSNIKELFATGISMQNLSSVIKQRVHSDRVVMILDSCHSGAVSPNTQAKGLTRTFNVDANALAQGTGQLVITSSLPQERSWESNRYKSSVFTKHLIDGLKKNGDATTLGDAFQYTQKQVQQEVQRDRGVLQTPVLKSQWKGNDLLLAAKPEDPVPGVKIEVGNVKIIVVPDSYSDNDSSNQENNQKEKVTVKISPIETRPVETKPVEKEKPLVQEKNTGEKVQKSKIIVNKLPKKFRLRAISKNQVIAANYDNSGVFEWDENKLYYRVKWDSGKRGKAHVASLENNEIVIKENTRFFWGMCHNTYKGIVINDGTRMRGDASGHDAWTKWKGTWEAWW